jgi:simple sugar transport system ATP-binding protein
MKNKRNQPLVKMVNITKKFGKVQALKDVDLIVNHKEVLGLLGDNGAGKSTLIKILVGLYPPEHGEIYLEGKKVQFSSPREARAMGIETVYQGLALAKLMSISRNFFLGREPVNKIGPLKLLDKRRMDKVCKKVLSEIGITIRSPDESVSFLSGGERQSISIGRAVHFGAKLLILDEPTAALSINEAAKVLDYIRESKKRGLSVIFITHNIYHVYSVAERFTILNRGIRVGDFDKENVTPEDITKMISKGKRI